MGVMPIKWTEVQYAASSNFNGASESLGQSDYSPTELAAETRGELGAKSNMPPDFFMKEWI